MTGSPRFDREDSSSNCRWGERPKVGGRVFGNNQRLRGTGRPCQPGPCLWSAGQSRPGFGPCVRPGSPRSARALSRKRVTAADDSPAPARADPVAGALARLAWPCLGSPDSESGRALPVSWVTVACRLGIV